MKRSKQYSMSREELLALEAYSSSNFFKINKKLFKVFGPLDALLISELMDKFLYFKDKNMLTEDGFFFLTHEMIEDHIGMSPYQIRERKKFFRENDLLETSMRGIPAKEFYKVNIENLLDYIDEKLAEKGCSAIPLKTSRLEAKKLNEYTSKNLANIKENKSKENKSKENINNTLSEENLPGDSSIKKKPSHKSKKEILPVHKSLAKRLQTIVSSVDQITAGTNLIGWPDHFRKLNTIDKVPIKDIRLILRWYAEHIEELYVPECYSAASFRKKFTKLQSAIKRTKSQKGKTRKGGAEVIPGKYDNIKVTRINSDGEEI